MNAETQGKQGKKGQWSSKEPPKPHVNDVSLPGTSARWGMPGNRLCLGSAGPSYRRRRGVGLKIEPSKHQAACAPIAAATVNLPIASSRPPCTPDYTRPPTRFRAGPSSTCPSCSAPARCPPSASTCCRATASRWGAVLRHTCKGHMHCIHKYVLSSHGVKVGSDSCTFI